MNTPGDDDSENMGNASSVVVGSRRGANGSDDKVQGMTSPTTEPTRTVDSSPVDDGNDCDDPHKKLRRLECIVCWLYVALGLIVSYVLPWNHYQRDIPVMTIDSQEESSSFRIPNVALNEPLQESSLSTLGLVGVFILVPFVIQTWLSYLLSKQYTTPLDRTVNRHCTVCVYCVSMATTVAAFETVKLYCGNLRPHFYTVCQPNEAYTDCQVEDDEDLVEGRKAFPSGHAAVACNGMVLLMLYIDCHFGMTALRRKRSRHDKHEDNNHAPWRQQRHETDGASLQARAITVVSRVGLGALALWMSVSRVREDLHFAADIVGGALLGGTVAYSCHYLWFGDNL